MDRRRSAVQGRPPVRSYGPRARRDRAPRNHELGSLSLADHRTESARRLAIGEADRARSRALRARAETPTCGSCQAPRRPAPASAVHHVRARSAPPPRRPYVAVVHELDPGVPGSGVQEHVFDIQEFSMFRLLMMPAVSGEPCRRASRVIAQTDAIPVGASGCRSTAAEHAEECGIGSQEGHLDVS